MEEKTVFGVAASFDTQLVAGNMKKAMAEADASKRDLWYVPFEQLHIMPGFNVRVKDAAYYAAVREYADDMKINGYYPHKPMAVFVSVGEDGVQRINVTDGHTRYESIVLARSEGAEINDIPVALNAKGTSLADLTVALRSVNEGRPLSAYEKAVVAKRLIGFGWDVNKIAQRLAQSQTTINNWLTLMAAPEALHEMVHAGEIAASTVLEAIRVHGAKAVDVLKASQAEKVARTGIARIKHGDVKRGPPTFAKAVKKAAPKLYETFADVRGDAGYAGLSDATRTKIEALAAELEALKAAADAVSTAAASAGEATGDGAVTSSGEVTATGEQHPESKAAEQGSLALTD